MEPAQLPLRDIHLPPGVGWWPPAIGWWLLALLIVLIIGLGSWLYKRITKISAVKSAKKQLLQLKLDKQLDNAQKLARLSMLIRRVAISTANRNECAGLTGQHWLEFLDGSMKDKPFSQGAGRLFGDAVYSKAIPSDQEIGQLISLCETWLTAQRKKLKQPPKKPFDKPSTPKGMKPNDMLLIPFMVSLSNQEWNQFVQGLI